MSHDDLPRDLLLAGLTALGVEAAAAEPLLNYAQELVRWNPTYRLVAVEDAVLVRIVQRHLLDSLAALPVIEELLRASRAPVTIIDIGSGAGLPGIPLHIVLRSVYDLTTILVERMDRRVRFLRATVAALSLGRVRIEATDALELARRGLLEPRTSAPPHAAIAPSGPLPSTGSRVVIVFRAVTELSADFLSALRRIGGEGAALCAYKADAADAAQELERVGTPWSQQLRVGPIVVPGASSARSVVFGDL